MQIMTNIFFVALCLGAMSAQPDFFCPQKSPHAAGFSEIHQG